MLKKRFLMALGASFIALSGVPVAVQAAPLNFTFLNPSFGGNPLNGSYLLALTESQKKFKEKTAEPTLADQFKDQFQTRILSAAVSKAVDQIQKDIDKTKPGGKIIQDSFKVEGITIGYIIYPGDKVVLTVNDGLSETSLDIPLTLFHS